MSSGLVYLRPVFVMFVRAHGAYGESATNAWQKMFKWIDENNQRHVVQAGYGLLHDNPKVISLDECRYDACIEVPDGFQNKIPETFAVQRLPGGAFARRKHQGTAKEIAVTISDLRDRQVKDSGLSFDPRRPVLEIYHDDPDKVPDGKRKIDVCLPVTAEPFANASQTAA